MFQEVEYKVLPVAMIDGHHQSSIVKLYIAYSPSRETLNQQGDIHVDDKGGHLISVSADGTICSTDLKSHNLRNALHTFTPKLSSSDKKRADDFMRSKQKD